MQFQSVSPSCSGSLKKGTKIVLLIENNQQYASGNTSIVVVDKDVYFNAYCFIFESADSKALHD